VLELPADFLVDRLGAIRSGQTDRFRGVGGCAQRVRAHVSDAGGLCSSPCRSHGRRRAHCVRGPTSNEPPPYLTGGIELTASKRPSPSDGITGSTIRRSLRFEHGQDPLGKGDLTPVFFATSAR